MEPNELWNCSIGSLDGQSQQNTILSPDDFLLTSTQADNFHSAEIERRDSKFHGHFISAGITISDCLICNFLGCLHMPDEHDTT